MASKTDKKKRKPRTQAPLNSTQMDEIGQLIQAGNYGDSIDGVVLRLIDLGLAQLRKDGVIDHRVKQPLPSSFDKPE